MKIASFNINNINCRWANLLDRLRREAQPDIVCLQETKAADPDFSGGSNSAVGSSRGMERRDALERRGDLAKWVPVPTRREQGGKNGAVALVANGVVLRRLEVLARLMIGDRRRLAFAARSLAARCPSPGYG